MRRYLCVLGIDGFEFVFFDFLLQPDRINRIGAWNNFTVLLQHQQQVITKYSNLNWTATDCFSQTPQLEAFSLHWTLTPFLAQFCKWSHCAPRISHHIIIVWLSLDTLPLYQPSLMSDTDINSWVIGEIITNKNPVSQQWVQCWSLNTEYTQA